MNVTFALVNKVTIILLALILIVQGLDMMLTFGLGSPLFHIFWLVVACYIGVFVGVKYICSG